MIATVPTPLLRRAGATLAAALLAAAASAGTASAATGVEAEALSLNAGAGQTFADAAASGGRGLLIWTTATATGTVTTPVTRLRVRARGDQCGGAPRMRVQVDGTQVLDVAVPDSAWTTYDAAVSRPAGSHTLAISYTNDAALTGCDRNLRVDRIDLDNPLRGATLYVDPSSNARRQADAWRTTRPGDAALMDRIANRSQADWFGGWSGDVAAAVDRRVSAASAAGAVPVLVAYNIPLRDCGSYSAGGAASADAYRSWIAAFARGIGTRRAIVVLEPDALGLTDCLSAADADLRYALLSSAVTTLSAQPGVAVYLDGGNSHWRSAADMSARLTRAGVARARGFSLNVSNYNTTANELAYGRDVSSRLGGKTFVIDTSRNGLGPTPDFQWCNAPGRALGAAPTTSTGQSGADAYLWIKRPGESDGTCNGGPPAGQWWADYALGLAARAAG